MKVWKLVISSVIYVYLSYDLTRKAIRNTTRDLPMDVAAMRYKINRESGTPDSVLPRTRIGGIGSRNSGVHIEEIGSTSGTNYPMVRYTGPRTQRRTTSVRRPPSEAFKTRQRFENIARTSGSRPRTFVRRTFD